MQTEYTIQDALNQRTVHNVRLCPLILIIVFVAILKLYYLIRNTQFYDLYKCIKIYCCIVRTMRRVSLHYVRKVTSVWFRIDKHAFIYYVYVEHWRSL